MPVSLFVLIVSMNAFTLLRNSLYKEKVSPTEKDITTFKLACTTVTLVRNATKTSETYKLNDEQFMCTTGSARPIGDYYLQLNNNTKITLTMDNSWKVMHGVCSVCTVLCTVWHIQSSYALNTCIMFACCIITFILGRGLANA